MDPEDDTGSVGQGQNLHDLQNYLSTFNKEIEPGDDVLSNMDVDGGVGDDSDLYSSNSGNPLQEPGEGTVTSQFSSGFYSEQGILDTQLSDESAQQIQNLVAEADRDTDVDIKQEVGSIDLESVQAQIAGFRDAHLSHGISHIHSSSLSQGLIMTSLGDNLDPSAGKVIRIVSLGEDGQFLSLADGTRMQILNHDLGISSDTLSTSDGTLGNDAVTANTSPPNVSSILTAVSTASMVVGGRGNIMTSATDNISSSGNTRLVALQTSSDNAQPQLVAISHGSALTTEALQISGLLSADGTINSELGYQTITILPSELTHPGDMNYVLIMAAHETVKDGTQSLAQVVEDLKQESQELSEELVEINGEMKRVLRVIPKKFIAANFGAQLMCDYCDYTSPKRYLLTRHMKSHSDERPHKCKECDRGFKTSASLLNHINVHTGTRPHKCKTCEAAFTTSGELVRHIRYRHTFEKPHRCTNCDYASVELSKLKRHMRSHTGERPYTCPHCEYASPDTYKLKRHLRIHTGEKPYECDICHARFTQSNSLKAHKLIHSGNKPVFQCDLCPTTCGRKTDLKIHFNKLHSVGSPLECKKCGQVFSDRYSYKQHVRGHDVDKCLKCDQCDFVANTERMFDLHAAVHTNGKKFECDSCHSSFNLKQSLEKHKHSCHLGTASWMDSQSSSSRDKEQNKAEGVFSLVSSSSTPATSGHVVSGPLASDTLHKNLLQDIKAGKLGDVPQVVIVHPDGSLEEISSKGDKLNLEDIFSALSSNGKTDSTAESGERSQTKGSNRGIGNIGKSNKKQKNEKEDLSDDEEEEEEENGETSQCEASTQAELESDTDSVDDDSHSVGSPAHFHKEAEKESQHQSSTRSESTGDQSAVSDTETTPIHMTDASSDALGSLLQNMPTSSTALSSATLSSLLPLSSDQTVASGQQFVVVKGYTCLNNDTSQPTLVNVAVDKDSLMKMFASLTASGESGMQLLAGDLESSIGLSIENSQATVLPLSQLQLHHFGIVSGVPGSLIVGANFEPHDDSDALQNQDVTKNEMILENSSDVPKDRLSPSSETGINVTTCSDSQPRDMIDLTSRHESTYSDISIFVDNSASTDVNDQTGSTSSSSSSSLVSLKMSLSNEQLTDQQTTTDRDMKTLPDEQLESDIQPSSEYDNPEEKIHFHEHLGSRPMTCSLGNISTDVSAEHGQAISQITSINVRTVKCAAANTDTSSSQDLPASITQQKHQSVTKNEITTDIHGAMLPNIKGELVLSQDGHKRSNKKRTATADVDPSLVMTGKRIRKSLIKVSM